MVIEDRKGMIVEFSGVHCRKIRQIRNKVFTQEQGINESIDFDGQDEDAVHALIKAGDQFVGTGRMLRDGHIGRLAVMTQWRGKKYGRKLLDILIDQAKKQGLKKVYLGAQWESIGFYERCGFQRIGQPFMEAGIKHITMEKRL